VSPDGREVAFHSFRTGNRDVFVMRATGGGEVQVTTSPQSDGSTLYFTTVEDAAGQFTMKAVPADGGTPRTLAYGNDPLSQGRRYGLAVNGERLFLPLVERNADIWVAEIREE